MPQLSIFAAQQMALTILALTSLMMVAFLPPQAGQNTRLSRLAALFLFVTLHATLLTVTLAFERLSEQVAGSFFILTALCLVWAVAPRRLLNEHRWRVFVVLGLAGAMAVTLSAGQAQPLPWQPLVIALGLGSEILARPRPGKAGRSHSLAPLAVSLAAGLSGLGLVSLSYLVHLMAYGALIYALHLETALAEQQRHAESEALSTEAHRIQAERRRIVEVSQTLSEARSEEILAHTLRVMAHSTGAEQAVIFSLGQSDRDLALMQAIYRTNRGDSHNPKGLEQGQWVRLSEVALLGEVVDLPQTLYVGHHSPTKSNNQTDLALLYAIWYETEIGPTVLQALTFQEQVIGVLVLGQPHSKRPFNRSDLRLCETLGPQISGLLRHSQQVDRLQRQVSARAQDVEAAENSWAYLAEVLDRVTEGVLVSNHTGQITLANQTAAQLLNTPQNKLTGSSIGRIYGKIDSRQSIERLAQEFSRRNQALPTYLEQDGRVIQGRLIPLRNENQIWMGMMAIFRDITETTRTHAAERDFITAVSRTINNALITINNYADLIGTGAVTKADMQQAHFTQVIKAEVGQIREALTNAEAVVKEQLSPLRLNRKSLHLRRLLLDVADYGRFQAQTKGLTFEAELADNLPFVEADPEKLRLAVQNLLSNAFRFTFEPGRVLLRAWVEEKQFAHHSTNYVIIGVYDTGVGISAGVKDHIFERYYQRRNESAPTGEGLGLGLAVVKDVVEAHGGRVWAESEEGQGSVFRIALPVQPHTSIEAQLDSPAVRQGAAVQLV